MFTFIMMLKDAWEERQWRKQKYLESVDEPLFKESYIMTSVGKKRVLLKVEH